MSFCWYRVINRVPNCNILFTNFLISPQWVTYGTVLLVHIIYQQIGVVPESTVLSGVVKSKGLSVLPKYLWWIYEGSLATLVAVAVGYFPIYGCFITGVK